MRRIAWSPKSIRVFKRIVRQNPQLRPLIEQTLQQLAEDAFHPSLRTHKLTGNLSGIWACSIDYSYRVLFEFVDEEATILLLNLGSHDEVY
ncbi:type II toxin-antitoxin system mRNA interferase toxin, RelE/StbE family [Leptolyngbya sp. FACHB-36]|uniref:type II toxin-antitoxin system RelE/ParE family toxin n=1 Tax=Leptolyngbya sp. FACHB-36 TaxID=2692808 RepID=UPI0016803E39|nr:type II toxin-antitoxin system mRNA interferase toxin, RelE/StbE family [Leptolyngbya sp. FACHB-36]MBD2020250.1 type II toxin-antitoxin system mRNA interferase toxin, RelE/StbE family [Leptolyngbya sp. FACHB-36]